MSSFRSEQYETSPPVRAEQAWDPYQPYRSGLLSPEQVRRLSNLRPARPVLDAFGCWAVILAAWTTVALWPRWWTILVAIPVVGTRYYALFIIGHDGLHRRIFNSRRLNDLFSDLFIYGPIGGITRFNNRNHLSHHHHLATEHDPDRYKHGCFNKTTRTELLGYLTGLTAIVPAAMNVLNLPSRGTALSSTPYTVRDLAILFTWQVALVGALSLGIGLWAYPVLWLLPVFVFTVLADLTRSFAEHSHPEADQEADRHRLITYLSPSLERLFLAPLNMNFHAVHHLWPSIPYYNLPQADREIRRSPGADGLVWRGSYLAYLWRYWRRLPLPECRRPGQVMRNENAGPHAG